MNSSFQKIVSLHNGFKNVSVSVKSDIILIMSSSTSGHQKKNHSLYSTFIDNENYNTAATGTSRSNVVDDTSSVNSSTTRRPYSTRLSSSSLHSTYALPPLPDPVTPSEVEKTKNGTTTHTSNRSRFGTILIRLGTACCPCLSPGRVVNSTPTGGSADWLWAFGRRLLLAVSLNRGSRSEDTRLLHRSASEEEILSKRPRFIKKNNGDSKLHRADSATSDPSQKNENELPSKSSSKISRRGSNDTGIVSPDVCDEDEEEDSLSSLRSTRKDSEIGGIKALGGKSHSVDGITGVIPKDPTRKRRSRRDQAKIAKTVGKGKPGPAGVVSARFRPPHEIQRTSSASSVINRVTAKGRPSMYQNKRNYYIVSISMFSLIISYYF